MPKQPAAGKRPATTVPRAASAARRAGRGKPPAAKGGAGKRAVADRETEARILEAARRVFVRRGTAGARMQEIAAEAGVNQALLHYYFRSKERLSTAVFQQFAARFFPVLIQILGADTPLPAKIDALIAAYLDNLARHPFLPGYLLSEIHHHPERATQLLTHAAGGPPARTLRPVLEILRVQIAARVADGAMRPISAEQLVANLISLCVFPFAARQLFCAVFELDDAGFSEFVEQRKIELPGFVHRALRP